MLESGTTSNTRQRTVRSDMNTEKEILDLHPDLDSPKYEIRTSQLMREPEHDDSRNYNTVQDNRDYEDPEYFYGGIGQSQSNFSEGGSNLTRKPMIGPPPPPPPMMKPTHIAIQNTKRETSKWRVICVSLILFAICVLLIASIVTFLIVGSNARGLFHKREDTYVARNLEPLFPLVQPEFLRKSDMDVSINHLLTLIITKRRLCLFEAGTGDDQQSLELFNQDHIESARLLYHSNLSHAGVPVHPLQFQRYARSLGVDNDCHVVIYDRGQVIWSTYAAWIFKLFGHSRVSILSGGYLAWKTQQGRSSQYRTEKGEIAKRRQGDFLSSWNNSVIITFDDVFLNTELRTYDLVDAQTKDEYAGTAPGALFGHIRDAVNIPVDTVYDWGIGQWLSPQDLSAVFLNAGITPEKPQIVYCSTSLRSSMIWWSLARLGYNAKIYFGGWPEWVVRAPDDLKILNN